jgi:type I restriction enzyme, S subunit
MDDAPVGWKTRRFGEFCREFKRINLEDRDLEPLSVTKHRGIVLQSEKFNKRIATDTSKYKVVKRGEFAYDPMSLYYGAIGRLTAIDEGVVSPAYITFDIDSSVDRHWFWYLVNSELGLRAFIANTQGGNLHGKRRKTDWSAFSAVAFPTPPLAEQKKIAAILSSVDEAIRANEAVIEQTRRVKEGLLQALLTRGIGHTEFRETEIGPFPVGWDVVTLATISELVTSGPRGWAQYYSETGPLFIRSQNIRSGTLDLTDVVRVAPPADAEADRSRLATDDILITITGNSVGNVGRVGPNEAGSYASQHVGVVRLLDRSLASFVMAFIAPGGPGNRALMGNAYGQSKPGLNLQQLRSLMVPLPDSHERSRIDEIIRSYDESLAAQLAQREVLGTLKSGLLQDLLTGKVRVSP